MRCFGNAVFSKTASFRECSLHRMEVMLMNHFDFKDLMSFGMFILALLTFIYLICH